MINKKLLSSFLNFSQQQKPAPSFILLYVFTWLIWHNQIFTAFFSQTGDVIDRLMAAYQSVEENQYMLVLFLALLFLVIRLGYNYIVFKSQQLVMSVDDEELLVRGDQLAQENDDIKALMTTLTNTQAQLKRAQEREKQAITEKNNTIAKLLATQAELEEALADNQLLAQQAIIK
ncbi:hypothetical protein [Thalassotalea piscium]|uniref:Uncharacterized protein HemX n=1 Tax=Thalassotalea piscium TaxID=1230533 RepID=A0A7X0NKA9_9GAMM|nr:hypothetical protein [Thalassotalea piscium]MBB6544988.1 uncharacterized protein HemX [Thalassotalea piscium]